MARGEESSPLPLAITSTPRTPARRALASEPSEAGPALYRFLRSACAPALHMLFSFRVAGAEHLPARGPFIVAANHHNYLDGVVLGVAIPRRVAFLVMPRVYHASPLHPPLHRRIGSIPLNLTRPDPGAIKRALRELDGGGVVGIFPEGPFSRDGQLVKGQPGVAMIALRSRVPVVPAGIRGTYEALCGRRLYLPRRHPISVRFGPPIRPLPAADGPIARAERQEVTHRIMSAIRALLLHDEVTRAGASEQGPAEPAVAPGSVEAART